MGFGVVQEGSPYKPHYGNIASRAVLRRSQLSDGAGHQTRHWDLLRVYAPRSAPPRRRQAPNKIPAAVDYERMLSGAPAPPAPLTIPDADPATIHDTSFALIRAHPHKRAKLL